MFPETGICLEGRKAKLLSLLFDSTHYALPVQCTLIFFTVSNPLFNSSVKSLIPVFFFFYFQMVFFKSLLIPDGFLLSEHLCTCSLYFSNHSVQCNFFVVWLYICSFWSLKISCFSTAVLTSVGLPFPAFPMFWCCCEDMLSFRRSYSYGPHLVKPSSIEHMRLIQLVIGARPCPWLPQLHSLLLVSAEWERRKHSKHLRTHSLLFRSDSLSLLATGFSDSLLLLPCFPASATLARGAHPDSHIFLSRLQEFWAVAGELWKPGIFPLQLLITSHHPELILFWRDSQRPAISPSDILDLVEKRKSFTKLSRKFFFVLFCFSPVIF